MNKPELAKKLATEILICLVIRGQGENGNKTKKVSLFYSWS